MPAANSKQWYCRFRLALLDFSAVANISHTNIRFAANQVETECQERGLASQEEVLEFLKRTTMVGLLPGEGHRVVCLFITLNIRGLLNQFFLFFSSSCDYCPKLLCQCLHYPLVFILHLEHNFSEGQAPAFVRPHGYSVLPSSSTSMICWNGVNRS